MAEVEKDDVGIMQKLALISDATQSLFPESKSAIVYELKEKDFKEVIGHFREIDRGHKKFKIDMSGVEIIFILENQFDEEQINQTTKKKSFLSKLIPFIGRKSSVKN